MSSCCADDATAKKGCGLRLKPPLRSWLYVPGDDTRKIANASATDADVIILDLEDGVTRDRKAVGREAVADALTSVDFGRSRRVVRLNGLDTEFWERDCEMTCAVGADGIVIPKASNPQAIRRLGSVLERLSPSDSVPAIAVIVTEDVEGVFAAAETMAAHERVAVAIWGSEDLSASLGAWRVKDEHGAFLDVFRQVRGMTLLQAARLGKPAIDTPFLALEDDRGLRREAEEAAWMGFAGKQAVHPRQIRLINDAFTPLPADVAAARELVGEFERDSAAVVRVGDQMADSPHLLRARRMLALAESLGAGG